jgi:hypothetical protein
MSITNRILFVIFSSVAGILFVYILNFLILQNILNPDPCYYHTNESNKLFDLFYELTAYDGFHPFPSKFNFIFTAANGFILGITFALSKIKKSSQHKNK